MRFERLSILLQVSLPIAQVCPQCGNRGCVRIVLFVAPLVSIILLDL